jgi:serine/threonine protein kinase
MSKACPERPGRLIGGRYHLIERLGTGGMATVYRARDQRLKREVAVKLIAEHLAHEPAFVRRFRREARLCASLAHPNIVAILDAGFEPRDFIVVELVDGVDAGSLLQARGRVTQDHAVHLLAQVCEALEHAHGRDVIHRDVAPRNILIARPGRTAKLADFGLASSALDVPAAQVADTMGTPGYVAPEVLGGARPSPRSDLYSLGVVAQRFLAGPSSPDDPHATSRGVAEAVQQAVANDPEARQDSVAEFRVQLIDGHDTPLRLQPAA